MEALSFVLILLPILSCIERKDPLTSSVHYFPQNSNCLIA